MVKSFRESGEFRESSGFGPLGPGGGDKKQKQKTQPKTKEKLNDSK